VTRKEFQSIEMAESVDYDGNLYGCSVKEIERCFATSCIPVVVVEPNGMNQMLDMGARKGWNVYNIYVDCPIDIQLKRFLSRFADNLKNTSETEKDKLIKTYARRLDTMFGVESEWLNIFSESGNTRRSQYIPLFDKDNETEIVEFVIRKIFD
jgi:guanylate kinase